MIQIVCISGVSDFKPPQIRKEFFSKTDDSFMIIELCRLLQQNEESLKTFFESELSKAHFRYPINLVCFSDAINIMPILVKDPELIRRLAIIDPIVQYETEKPCYESTNSGVIKERTNSPRALNNRLKQLLLKWQKQALTALKQKELPNISTLLCYDKKTSVKIGENLQEDNGVINLIENSGLNLRKVENTNNEFSLKRIKPEVINFFDN